MADEGFHREMRIGLLVDSAYLFIASPPIWRDSWTYFEKWHLSLVY